ncbi:MAG TPA: 2,3-bisphosphoglycerate-independent phosphoglycerate mutase [Phycisphaerae bacterium]|nr:2,3-bisphosphoglycerate-independent phosphoglycerate mutase [Phycisphaerae bacterium]
MSAKMAKRPFVLIVRDGWGKNPHPEMDSYNAVKQAKHPVDDRLMAEYPNVLIKTSGEDVGLPAGVMGNSEVGHQNIGAGRIVDQETMRITNRIRDGIFFRNETLIAAFANAKKHNSTVHILGLCSDGRVHSDQEHAYALLEMARRQNFPSDRVLIHAITDGRDTAPTGASRFLPALEAKCKEIGIGRIATVIGRFYAMDRDNRWERVQTAYDLLTQNKGEKYPTASDALEHYYRNASDASRGGDEFVMPSVIGAGGTIKDHDTVIFFNYRGDRPREITKAFVYDDAAFAKEPNGGFTRATRPTNLFFATMAGYEDGLPVHVIFDKPAKMADILGETIARAGLTQMRSAETEKFPHVTFFFDDYREPRKVDKTTMDGIGAFEGEEIRGAHSRKDIKTYDLAPEMSAETLTVRILEAIAADKHDVYIINYANGDMVGHTGSLPAAVKAVEKVDECVGRVAEAALKKGGALIITADHGNCEQMWDPINNCPHTAHTTYDVPLIVVDDRFKGAKLRAGGRLADIAPTALKIIGLPQPKEMTGQSLLP